MTRLAFLPIASIVLCSACGGSGTASSKTTGPPPGAGRQVSNSGWAEVVSNPDAFRGATATLVGRVFSVQNSADGRYRAIHVWADARKSREETTIIATRGFPILSDDYVRVRGVLAGTLRLGNTFGVGVRGPVVVASRLVRVTAVAAASPTRQRLHGKPYTVFDVTLTPYRVDLADDETRVFLRIQNPTGFTLHYVAEDSYVLSDGVRGNPKSNLGYPRLPADIGPETTVEGVTTFQPVSPTTTFKFVTRFSSDDSKVGTLGITTPIIWTWNY
jgi:hypothetical protein